MRYAQLVLGPAGSGKSRYCSTMQKHAANSGRRIDVVNLDPAAEQFDYEPLADVKDLISVDDVMEDEDLKYGPNGGLVFCLEFLLENIHWLEEALDCDSGIDDDYIIFDCPGQIELYTHLTVMKQLVEVLHSWNFRVCGVFLVDSHFMVDGAKFISGSTIALCTMINLEIPHVNVLSKLDLLSPSAKRHLDVFLHPDTRELTSEAKTQAGFGGKFARMTAALGQVLEDYSLVKFFPLDPTDESNVNDLLITVDNTIQYGEDLEVRTESKEDLTEIGGEDD